MDGKITVNQILFTLIIGGMVALWGISDRGNGETITPNIIVEQPITEPNIPNTEPNDIPVEVWEIVMMNVSAYCPCEICCEMWGKILVSSGKRTTASGYIIREGDVFVAAPAKYPFGTEMIVPGYAGDKVVEVKDIGGAIKGDRLDVFFFTHQEALEWGREKEHPVKVRVK